MDSSKGGEKTLPDYTANRIESEDILRSEKLLKAAFTQAIEENLSSGQIVKRIDLTEWLAHQFRTATNNEQLHANIISKSGFFEKFPEFLDTDNLARFCLVNSDEHFNNYPYITHDGSDHDREQKKYHVYFNILTLRNMAHGVHTEINKHVVGRKIAMNISPKISETILKCFVLAHDQFEESSRPNAVMESQSSESPLS